MSYRFDYQRLVGTGDRAHSRDLRGRRKSRIRVILFSAKVIYEGLVASFTSKTALVISAIMTS